MKKTILVLLIIIFLFNTIIPNYSFGTAVDVSNTQNSETADLEPGSQESFNQLWEEGEASASKDRVVSTVDSTQTMQKSGFNILSGLLNLFPIAASSLMSLVAMDEDNKDERKLEWFTIEDLVFDEISLFNINFFNSDVEENGTKSVNTIISENVLQWFSITSLLSIIISLCVLIYIGIRMAISSLAEEKAKYKAMLKDWFVSLLIIFLLPYIIVAAVTVSDKLVEAIHLMADNGQKTFELQVVERIFGQVNTYTDYNLAVASIVYWILVFYQLKFFFLYARRLLTTAFLIMIAPFITVTYAIDRAGDNRAQAFNSWMREFMVNVFIQPLHAMLYMVFMYSAGEIAKVAPIFAILFFMGLSRGEKIVKDMFKMRGMKSINSMSETVNVSKLDRGDAGDRFREKRAKEEAAARRKKGD